MPSQFKLCLGTNEKSSPVRIRPNFSLVTISNLEHCLNWLQLCTHFMHDQEINADKIVISHHHTLYSPSQKLMTSTTLQTTILRYWTISNEIL